MKKIDIKNAKENLFKLVSDVNDGYGPITFVNNKGKNAVLISQDVWNSIQETLYLSSIPGFTEDIIEIDKNTNWEKAKTYNPEEDW